MFSVGQRRATEYDQCALRSPSLKPANFCQMCCQGNGLGLAFHQGARIGHRPHAQWTPARQLTHTEAELHVNTGIVCTSGAICGLVFLRARVWCLVSSLFNDYPSLGSRRSYVVLFSNQSSHAIRCCIATNRGRILRTAEPRKTGVRELVRIGDHDASTINCMYMYVALIFTSYYPTKQRLGPRLRLSIPPRAALIMPWATLDDCLT